MSKIIPNLGKASYGKNHLSDFGGKKLPSVVHGSSSQSTTQSTPTTGGVHRASLTVRVKNSSLIKASQAAHDVGFLKSNPTPEEISAKIIELQNILRDLNPSTSIHTDETPTPSVTAKTTDEKEAVTVHVKHSDVLENTTDNIPAEETESSIRQHIEEQLAKLKELEIGTGDEEIQEIPAKMPTPVKSKRDRVKSNPRSAALAQLKEGLSQSLEESEMKFEEALKESAHKESAPRAKKKIQFHFPDEDIYTKSDAPTQQEKHKKAQPATPPTSDAPAQKTKPEAIWSPQPLTEDMIKTAQRQQLNKLRQRSKKVVKPEPKEEQARPTPQARAQVHQTHAAGVIPPDLLHYASAQPAQVHKPQPTPHKFSAKTRIAQTQAQPTQSTPPWQKVGQKVQPVSQRTRAKNPVPRQSTSRTQTQANKPVSATTEMKQTKPSPKKSAAQPSLKASIQGTMPKRTLEQEIAKNYSKRKKSGALAKFMVAASFAAFCISTLAFGTGFITVDDVSRAVAGAYDSSEVQPVELTEYEQWSMDNFNTVEDSSADWDDDGLTNFEEYLLGTDPTSKHTCDENSTDLDLLVNFVNPATCEAMDINSEDETSTFNTIISNADIRNKLIALESGMGGQNEETAEQPVGVLETFGVSNWDELNSINSANLAQEIDLNSQRQEYLRLIQKIDDYITEYRSYDVYDRDYAAPVHPAVYLETSVKYDVDLKYVLAIARLESRFGTDKYTNSGELTRPGAHQNVYSIGLDDSGNNNTFPSWEQGVTAFGRWYRRFDDAGVADCRKWRIYNPNGDYCAKVEAHATQIDAFLQE